MDQELLQLVSAALTHDLDQIALAPDAAPLRAAFHADELPAGCPPHLGSLARRSHRLAASAVDGSPDAHLRGPLQSLWARIELDASAAIPPLAYRPGPLPAMRAGQDRAARERLLPVAEALPPDQAFWRAFGRDLVAAVGTDPGTAAAVERTLNTVRRWTAALPAHAPDEPLLEHLQLTAAIAAALWQCRGAVDVDLDRPLLLVLLDLSGVQRYLFATAATAAGGVARRLRARSLTLALAAEALAHALLAALDLPPVNLLTASGGHSYLLLPNTPAALAVLDRTWRALEADLWRQYGGALAATIAWRRLGADDVAAAGGALHDLAARRAEAKLRPLGGLLQHEAGWQEDAWLSAEGFAGRTACTACGTWPASITLRDDLVCVACAADYRLGAALPRARFLAWTRTAQPAMGASGSVEVLPGFRVQAAYDLGENVGAPFLVQQLNAFEPPDDTRPVLGRYLATHVPVDEYGAARDFAAIAEQARGAPFLAVVKADVDRLGALFAWGLRRDGGEGFDSLARALALSRLVDTFFSGWVQGTLADGFPLCYTVYSGGDDLLLVGPWDQAIRALARLQFDFAHYTRHPQVTLSVGVAVIRSSTPIADAVRAAEEQEALAKEQGPTGGRNQLAIFDQALPWDQAARLLDRWQMLADGPDGAPGSVLHRWLGYAAAYHRSTGAEGLRAITHFAYDYARNKGGVSEALRQEWQRLLAELFAGRVAETMTEIAVLSRLLILSNRRGQQI